MRQLVFKNQMIDCYVDSIRREIHPHIEDPPFGEWNLPFQITTTVQCLIRESEYEKLERDTMGDLVSLIGEGGPKLYDGRVNEISVRYGPDRFEGEVIAIIVFH